MSNINRPLLNAYEEGMYDGALDAEAPEGAMEGDELSEAFGRMVSSGIFRDHQAQQYFVGYVRGARGNVD
jgi:hypothetical protein